jgi:diguanylate cyclase (GGDEF)-like protein
MDTTNTRVSSAARSQTEEPRPYLMVIGGARVGELHTLTRERTLVGRSPEAQIRLRDTGISREHAELVIEGGRVRVRDLGSTNGTFLNGERADARELRDGDKLSIGEATLLLFTHQDGLEASYQRGRFRAAVHDTGTSALRSEVFGERLGQEVSFARRHAAPLAVLAWEIDRFAALEARLGPQATHQCLAAVAQAARAVLNDDDLLGILGPGRFAVACRETDARAAGERAARVRAAVAATSVDGDGPRPTLTASVGIAVCGGGGAKTAAAALLGEATAALGAARASGGDRVALAPTAADATAP